MYSYANIPKKTVELEVEEDSESCGRMVGPLLYSEAHEIAMRAKAEGYAEEFAREYAEGYAKGYAEEFAGGYARGYFRGQLKMLKKMAENAFISADEAERLEQEIRREAGELLKTTDAFKDEYV